MGVSKRRHSHTWAFLIQVILGLLALDRPPSSSLKPYLHGYISIPPDATTDILSITRLVFKFRVGGIDQSQRAKIYGGANLVFGVSFPVRQHITNTLSLPQAWFSLPNIHDAAPKFAKRLTINLCRFLS